MRRWLYWRLATLWHVVLWRLGIGRYNERQAERDAGYEVWRGHEAERAECQSHGLSQPIGKWYRDFQWFRSSLRKQTWDDR